MKKKIKLSMVAASLVALTNVAIAKDLGVITVSSATKSEQSIKDVTSNVNVISGVELEEKNYKTVNEALSKIAGITVVSNGGMGTTSSTLVRGFGTSRLLILVDGIRYNDPSSVSGAQLEHIMVSDIDKIEIVKGAQSGIWGADAAAGVINIITKKSKYGFHADSNIEYGSFNTKKYLASVSHKTDKYSTKVSVGKISSDSFTAQAIKDTDIDKYEDDDYKNTTIKFQFKYNIDDNNKIELLHTNIKARTSYDGCYNKTWNPLYGGYYACSDNDIDKANSSTYYSDIDNDFSSIKFTNLNQFGKLNIFANKSIFDRSLNNQTNYIGGAKNGTIDSTKLEFDGETKEYGINENISYSKNSFLLVGLDKQEYTHKNSLDKEYSSKSAFITNSTNLENKTILTQTLRYSKNDSFENKTTGKIGIKYNISDDIFVSSNYGTAFKIPTIYQMYDPTYGDDSVKPEKIKSYDLLLSYKDFKIGYFHNTIENLISYHSSTYRTINKDGKSKLKGYEIFYSKDILEDLLFSLNYTRLDAKDSDGKDLIRRPEKTLDLEFDYYGFKDLHVNVNAKYVGKAYDEYWDSNTFSTVGYTRDSYRLLGSVINYNINKKFTAYVKMENITNKYYQNAYGYATSPRAFYAGVKYSF
jgi:vitamin B12 transporter